MNLFLKKDIQWVCHHLHLDKSKTINPNILDKSLRHMNFNDTTQ